MVLAGWGVNRDPRGVQIDGEDASILAAGGFAPQDGFETTITVDTIEPYVAVQAKHRSGQVLATSKAVKPRR